MSKLRDLMLSFLNDKNREIQEIVSMKTTAAENLVREKVVIPYCKKWGYSFDSGMGSYSFTDKEGETFYPGETCRYAKEDPKDGRPWQQDGEDWFLPPTDEDKEIQEILDFGFDSQNCRIGAFIKDYRNDEPWREQ
jgi:hypothetical protein